MQCLSKEHDLHDMISDIWNAVLQRTLQDNEKESLMAAEHRPNFILRILTELIWQAELEEGQSMRLDETLSFFEEQIGTCERCAPC